MATGRRVIAKTKDVLGGPQVLAAALLRDIERIAQCSAARMQELLPSYAKVPREELTPIVLANTRNLLEAVRDPTGDRSRERIDHQASGETRARQGITSDEMLHGWRIGLESVREEAYAIASQLEVSNDGLLEFVEATLRWGDIGMRASASAHHEAEIRELGRLVEEQAALRRVAVLVGQDVPPSELFRAVALEVGMLLGADFSGMLRYEDDAWVATVATWAAVGEHPPVPDRFPTEPGDPMAIIAQTRGPARVDDWAALPGPIAAVIRTALGVRSSVGTPVVVEGRLWGALAVHSKQSEPLPPDTEARIAQFADLVATAISNIQARSDLAASRARIVATADEERRRVVRDLHDGAQQRLVHTIVTLKLARRALGQDQPYAAALVGEALEHAETATEELRELAHGILPSVLTRGGLRAGVRALAARMLIPVETDVCVDRFPHVVEATAYFTVAEALTNVAKHSHAGRASVKAHLQGQTLHVEVCDDGVGGAQADGPGLLGLKDRLAVLDGTLRVGSPVEGGTLIAAVIPVRS